MSRVIGSLAVLALALACATAALAGGRVDIRPGAMPAKIIAGHVFEIPFTLAYPNGDPFTHADPVVIARCGRSKVEVPAVRTATAGAYVARVTLPRRGAWSFEIDSRVCGNKCRLAPAAVMAAMVPATRSR